jgi:hypothetical protein
VVVKQSGPRFDGAVRALCALVPAQICRWLGVQVEGDVHVVQLSEAVAPVTRQVDALVAVGDDLALHIEFQTAGEARFAWRMLDYRLRLAARPELVGRRLLQYAVVLGPGTVEGGITEERLIYSYVVEYLRDQPVAPLLDDPCLAPFAPLAHLSDDGRAAVLRQSLDVIAAVADTTVRVALARAAVDLAALHLDPATIDATWEESAMPIPSLLQRQYEEGLEKGLERGLEEAAAAVLRRRFGADERIGAIARHLAALGPDRYLDLVERAGSLDELAERPD